MNRRRSPRLAAVAAAAALALAAAAPAAAVPCALDEPPAATLLLPYFEVDLDGPLTTLVSIASATSQSALARVTLWSDLGVPVFWFDLYLTGWDVQTINLRDVLAGKLPQTAPDSADRNDTISPQGSLSADTDFPGCSETMPSANLDGAFVAHLRAALTGQPSPMEPETCYGFNHGDGVARGWVTVDSVVRCNTFPPGVDGPIDPAPGTGFAAGNVLWGDFLIVDPVENRASAANLVRLEAAPDQLGEGDRTFYGSFLGDASDAREPLPTVWATRYIEAGISGGSTTDLLYWRDPGEPSAPFACEADLLETFPWFPGQDDDDLVFFDEEENADVPVYCGVATCPPRDPFDGAFFQLVAGRTRVGTEMPVAFPFGWMYLDLDLPSGPTQAWLGTLVQADGRYSAALEPTPLDAPCAPGRPGPGASL